MLHLHKNKKTCRFRDESEKAEIGPPRKKRVLAGKRKEKEAVELVASGSKATSGLESASVDVFERILVEIQGMRAELQGVWMELREIRRTRRGVAADVGEILEHFVLEEESGKESEKDSEKDVEEADKTL